MVAAPAGPGAADLEAGLVARVILHAQRREVDEFMRLIGLEAFAEAIDGYERAMSGGKVLFLPSGGDRIA